MDIRKAIKEGILLFDGAMGTYYAQRRRRYAQACELANLTEPEEILAIHRAYREAGARALKTNTFGVNRQNFPETDCAALLRAGFALAKEAAGEDAFVFADIGPAELPEEGDPEAEYCFLIDRFLDLGAQNFLFETNSSLRGLLPAAAYLKRRSPEAFVLLSFAGQPDGFTHEGLPVTELCRAAAADPAVDAVGLNCVSGPRHMAELVRRLGPLGKPLSVMPNAGYPTVRGGRTYYNSDPDYFAELTGATRALGAVILGGCCGTTPAHIAALARTLRAPALSADALPTEKAAPEREARADDPFWEALCDPGRKPFAVELDPPEDADAAKFVSGARALWAGGADLITIADCPVARARVDSSLMACKLRRELGVNAMPHMTCRDRNLNATQALLMGLCAEGVGNVLVVTGDPIPTASRDEVKSVYNFNSRKLIRYVDSLNRSLLPRPFRIFGALNLNVRNFDVQLRLAREKEENGAVGFFTQPVHSRQALENLKRAREALSGKLLGGVMPIVSERNARFMNSEIAGITVDEEIIARYAGADRARGEALAEEISLDIARAMAPWVDGFYLITPFGRTALMTRIMESIRREGLTGEA